MSITGAVRRPYNGASGDTYSSGLSSAGRRLIEANRAPLVSDLRSVSYSPPHANPQTARRCKTHCVNERPVSTTMQGAVNGGYVGGSARLAEPAAADQTRSAAVDPRQVRSRRKPPIMLFETDHRYDADAGCSAGADKSAKTYRTGKHWNCAVLSAGEGQENTWSHLPFACTKSRSRQTP